MIARVAIAIAAAAAAAAPTTLDICSNTKKSLFLSCMQCCGLCVYILLSFASFDTINLQFLPRQEAHTHIRTDMHNESKEQ